MERITNRNSNGSIDILDDWGRCRYTIQSNENGLISDIGRKLAEYEDDAKVLRMSNMTDLERFENILATAGIEYKKRIFQSEGDSKVVELDINERHICMSYSYSSLLNIGFDVNDMFTWFKLSGE